MTRAESALKVCSAIEILEQVIGYGVKGKWGLWDEMPLARI